MRHVARKAGVKQKPNLQWTFQDKLYIAKFYEHDGYVSLARGYDVRPHDVFNLYCRLRNAGKIEQYKRYWDKLHGK